MENFGETLRKIRKSKNLTLREVESKTGISNSYLSQIEKGKRGIPSISILTRLNDAYNLQKGELFKCVTDSLYIESLHPGINHVPAIGIKDCELLTPLDADRKSSENVNVSAKEIEDIRKKYSELTPENRNQFNNFLSFLLDNQQKQSLK
jgi:transcriptional regulator with XRE-family HTH domain